jgi:uncharacterized protein DUF1488
MYANNSLISAAQLQYRTCRGVAVGPAPYCHESDGEKISPSTLADALLPRQPCGRRPGPLSSQPLSCYAGFKAAQRKFICGACWRCVKWIMPLNFPNQSRSYDATLRAVRFWGHDGAMEASFFVNEDALKRIQPDMRSDEAGLLSAFDAHRELIHATASKVYKRGRKGSYELSPDDF